MVGQDARGPAQLSETKVQFERGSPGQPGPAYINPHQSCSRPPKGRENRWGLDADEKISQDLVTS